MSGGMGGEATGASVVLTTKGDIVGYDTARKRIGVGINDDVLTADSTNANGLAWKTPSAEVGTDLTTKGDIHGYDTGQNRVPIGSNDDVLTADSTTSLGLAWKTAGGGATVSTKEITPTGGFDFSTTSTSFVDLTGVTITLATISGGKYLANFLTSSQNSANRFNYSCFNDNGSDDQSFLQETGNSGNQRMSMNICKVGTPSGQVLKGRVHVDGGTGIWFQWTAQKTASRISVLEVG